MKEIDQVAPYGNGGTRLLFHHRPRPTAQGTCGVEVPPMMRKRQGAVRETPPPITKFVAEPMDQTKIAQLIDREAIRDCLYRYCRGIDRADEAALRSAYWPDALDNHGAYCGPAEGFIQFALGVFKTGPRNIHQVTNILIEFINSAEAAVESYLTALQRAPDNDGDVRQTLLCGRYCDLFHKREGEWRIAERTVVYDWIEEQIPPAILEAERFGPRRPVGAPHPDDPVYRIGNGRHLSRNDASEASNDTASAVQTQGHDNLTMSQRSRRKTAR